MTAYLDLFSGIGGFALGAYMAGLRFDRHFFSEIDSYAIQVYKKRFPKAEAKGDIRSVNYEFELPKAEWLVTAGFPCQPHSIAGKKKGAGDERDLWPECRRMLRELRPAIALFENVPGLFISDKGEFFNRVLSDISESGYDAEWQVISAMDAGAPHLRKRVWIVAYPQKQHGAVERQETPVAGRSGSVIPNSSKKGFPKRTSGENRERRETEQPQRLCEIMADAESKRCCNGDDSEDQQQADRKIDASANAGLSCGTETLADTNNAAPSRQRKHGGEIYAGTETKIFGEHSCCEWWAVEPDVGRVANGIPFRVDRLKGIGNSIVPQCAELIFNLPAFDRWRITKEDS